ncbi:DUF4381 domain-containing protein [Marinospirillum sp. MEB164]|uniref:DUF4381 domain-containing protein n=1 Tax=Marinospirillum alkalitolerans TaxID=3123374 RepID=A0ABW8PW00_9GAMM
MNLDALQQQLAPLLPPLPDTTWPLWVWLTAAGASLGFVLLLFFLRWFRLTATRRYAYQELQAIYQRYLTNQDAPRYLYEVNLLLRRIAVRNFQRDHVASLTGEEWLTFLDWSKGPSKDPQASFKEGSGRILAWGAYHAKPQEFDAEQLRQLVRTWIRRQT